MLICLKKRGKFEGFMNGMESI